MPTQPLFRTLPPVTLDVTTTQIPISFLIQGDLFKVTYQETKSLSDGSSFPSRTFSVDRSLSVVDLSAITDQLYQSAEQFRQEDEDAKTAADAATVAEAARWAALTPDQQKAEVDADLAARQAAADADIAKNGYPDPTPSGAVSVTPTPTPITPAPVS